MPGDIPAHKWAEHLVFMRVLGTANTSLCNLYKRLFLNFCLSSMDGRPRPGLPSGKEYCKQSDPEQFGCPSVRRLLDAYGESETPSTQHRRLRLLRSSKTGDNSEQSSSLPDSLTLNEGEHKFTESSSHI